MIVLKHGKFISGAKIFRAGAVLPDNADVQRLVLQGVAEVVADVPKKSAKSEKSETASAETIQENAKINS